MSLKYEPKHTAPNQNNFFIVLKVAAITVIALSLLTIFLCFKKSFETKASPTEPAKVSAECPGKPKKASNSKHKKEKAKKRATSTVPVAVAPQKKAKKKNKAIAQAQTTFPTDESQSKRVFNIKKAAAVLNNVILKPGEEFSFEKIYKLCNANGKFNFAKDSNAKDIVYAGGLSQVCTTLFHAVKQAKLTVSESHNFNYKVFYSANAIRFEKGKFNFKFKNIKKFPIKITATVRNNYIKISIMKAKSPKN